MPLGKESRVATDRAVQNGPADHPARRYPRLCAGAGMAYARLGAVDLSRALLGLVVMEFANLAAHYWDEFADVDTDTLTQRTWFSGGSGVLPSGIVPPVWALRAARVMALLTAALVGWAVWRGALPVAVTWITAVGLLAGWAYSMRPLALERRGWGELDNALLGGLLMPLMGYAAQGAPVGLDTLLVLAPIVLFVLVGLMGVHWADRVADAAVGRISIVVWAGSRARALHAALLALAYLLTLALSGWLLPWPVVWATLLTVPLGAWAVIHYTRQTLALPSSAMMVAALLAHGVGWLLAVR
ncbi:MAG: prenyltransferase [Anaerolineae bacterium]